MRKLILLLINMGNNKYIMVNPKTNVLIVELPNLVYSTELQILFAESLLWLVSSSAVSFFPDSEEEEEEELSASFFFGRTKQIKKVSKNTCTE